GVETEPRRRCIDTCHVATSPPVRSAYRRRVRSTLLSSLAHIVGFNYLRGMPERRQKASSTAHVDRHQHRERAHRQNGVQRHAIRVSTISR
ncbi:hypothetical protein J4732_20080, partial [Serratia marcescens]|nr:hypothetical protein [Serratia marcescens]